MREFSFFMPTNILHSNNHNNRTLNFSLENNKVESIKVQISPGKCTRRYERGYSFKSGLFVGAEFTV